MNQLFYKIIFFAALLFYGNACAQIDYNEDFEDTIDWYDPDGWYYVDIPFGNCGNLAYITFLYSDYAGYEETSISPSIGISNGSIATLTYDYKIVLYSMPGVPLENDPSWGTIRVEYSTSETGPWMLIDEVNPGNHVVSTSCSTRSVQFTPPADDDIYLRLNVEVDENSFDIDALVYIDNIGVVQAELCQTAAPENLLVNQVVCTNSNVGDLDIADYNDIIWYDEPTGGEPLASNVLLDNGIYYASQFDVCESIERIAVTVLINEIEQPEAVAQTFCNSATVSDLEVVNSSVEVNWYANENGGLPLPDTAVLVTGTYYVAKVEMGCESPRTAVSVTVNIIEEPEAVAQTFCNSATVSDLEVDEDGIEVLWYAVEEGGTPLSDNTSISTGTYYAAQISGNCESPRTAVSVTLNIVTPPVVQTPQVFDTTPILLYDIDTEADGSITWYATEDDATEGVNPLPSSATITESGTYYVTQTINECESEPLAVAIEVLLGTSDFWKGKVTVYPNPVKDIFTMTIDAKIDYVAIYNSLGQQVMRVAIDKNNYVDISSLPSGTYILSVVTDSETIPLKIIKD